METSTAIAQDATGELVSFMPISNAQDFRMNVQVHKWICNLACEFAVRRRQWATSGRHAR